MERTKNKQFVA